MKPARASVPTVPMDTHLKCVNRGGLSSQLLLATEPVLEQEMAFADGVHEALDCWKARAGEVLTARAPGGRDYRVRVTHISPDGSLCVPFSQVPDPEPRARIVLYQALPEKERFELVLQKAVELGAAAVVPFVSHHSTSLELRDAGQRKSHRWPRVILRAARQSRRRLLPELWPVLDWSSALARAAAADLALICHPGVDAGFLPLPPRAGSVSLMVGPEGGFSGQEVEQAGRAGLRGFSLGPRILRTETAAIASLAIFSALDGRTEGL